MTASPSALPAIQSAEALRKAFDESFAHAPHPPASGGEDLLGVRLGEERWAFRLRDLVGLAPLRKLVPLPSRLPELIGLAGIGGAVLPVYDLGTLLGIRSDGARAPWLARCSAGADELALAFGRLDGHLRVRAEELFSPAAAGAARSHVAAVARAGEEMRSVVDLASVVARIRQRIGAPATRTEA